MRIDKRSNGIFFKFYTIFLIIFVLIIDNKSTKNSFYDLHPELYGREIFDQIKSKYNERLVMSKYEYYFVNGLIRLYKPKKLLEIGVCSGGMSAAILNSIKDIEGAKLYSCDLEKNNCLKLEI